MTNSRGEQHSVRFGAIAIPEGTVAAVPVPCGDGFNVAILTHDAGTRNGLPAQDVFIVSGADDWGALAMLFDGLAESCREAAENGGEFITPAEAVASGLFASDHDLTDLADDDHIDRLRNFL